MRASVSLDHRRPVVFDLPGDWPPRPAIGIVRQAETAYGHLKSLVTHERLASSPTHVAVTTYWAVAPDELRLETRGGIESVVIGTRRWDRLPGKAWKRTRLAAPLKTVAPYWGGTIQDATLLGTAALRGRRVSIVSFAAPQFPAFFTIWVDRSSHRVLQLHMTASAHFMRHTYSGFDRPLTIEPPDAGGAQR